ncbi:MAG TPA: hypothetical protein VF169_26625 [Albitalea sp.]|uniref:hypothetical protein n=1 Tax=Piscinibacter sp. TaxID=1903157 RepID=UPI002ED09982
MASAPTTQQHSFSWLDIARCLMKEKGITNGLWMTGVELGFAAANAGPTTGSVVPAGMVAVQSIVLTRAKAPGPLVFDAAELNPPHQKAATTAKRKSLAKPANKPA